MTDMDEGAKRRLEWREDVTAAIDLLGLSGRPVAVHSSLRSVGTPPLDPEALLQPLLAARCTVMVPTFSGGFAVSPPEDLVYEHNAEGHVVEDDSSWIFDERSVQIDDDMGAFPRFVLSQPEHVRGNHPLNSFTAIGMDAARLVGPLDIFDVYGPLKRLADLDGVVLLAGVGYWSMTLIHLAERNSGRTLFRRWALDRTGLLAEVEVGSCSAGFHAFRSHLDPLALRTKVGLSSWRSLPALPALHAATAAIGTDPRLTFCGDPACLRCADQRAGGPRRGE